MMVAVAMAEVAPQVTLEATLGACRKYPDAWRCTDQGIEYRVRARVLGNDAERARIGRWMSLSDWPRGRYEPAWLDGELGWQAVVDDGDRGWIGRWWVVGGVLYSQSVSGPIDGLDVAAADWFDRSGFVGRVVAAPRP